MHSPTCCYYEQYFYTYHVHRQYVQLDLKVQVVKSNINRILIKIHKRFINFPDGDTNYYCDNTYVRLNITT